MPMQDSTRCLSPAFWMKELFHPKSQDTIYGMEFAVLLQQWILPSQRLYMAILAPEGYARSLTSTAMELLRFPGVLLSFTLRGPRTEEEDILHDDEYQTDASLALFFAVATGTPMEAGAWSPGPV